MIKWINSFFVIVTCLIIIASALFIGAPIKYNIEPLTVFILIFVVINIFYYNVLCKKRIIKNKIDLLVILLLIMPIIPLTFKTYASLSSTINGIFKHLTVLGVYIMFSNTFHANKNIKKWIIWSIIISVCLIAFIGFDDFTFRKLRPLLDKIDCVNINNIENTMCANFGYTNTFALSIIVGSFLLLSKYIYTRNKFIKNLFLLINVFFISMLLLAEANAILLLYILSLIIYLICLSKEYKKDFLFFSILSFLVAAIHSYLFQKMCIEEQFLGTYIFTITLLIFTYLISLLLYELLSTIRKIKFKYIIILGIFVFILLIIVFIIGINWHVPLEIFENGTTNTDVVYKIKNIDGNKKYRFEFDIECKNEYGSYEILIVQEKKFYDSVKEHSIKFDNLNSIKTIEFISNENTIELGLIFKSDALYGQQGLKINRLLVNEKNYPLAYKYLPAQKINSIVGGLIQTKSIWERFSHYTDGIKIAKENLLVGVGEQGWNCKIDEIESFKQAALEAHTYIITLLINYGIFSVIIYLFLLFALFKYFIYSIKNKINLEIVFALICITLHSFIDFNLSFFYNELIYFLLFVTLTEEKDDRIYNKFKYISNVLVSLIFIIIYLLIIYLNIHTCIFKYHNYIFENFDDRKQFVSKYDKILPYYLTIKEEMVIYDYTKIVDILENEPYYYTEYYCEKLSKNNIAENEKEKIYDILKDMKISISIIKLKERNTAILNIANNFKEKNDYIYANKFYNLLIEEYESNKYQKILNSIQENRITFEEFEKQKELITIIYDSAKQKEMENNKNGIG